MPSSGCSQGSDPATNLCCHRVQLSGAAASGLWAAITTFTMVACTGWSAELRPAAQLPLNWAWASLQLKGSLSRLSAQDNSVQMQLSHNSVDLAGPTSDRHHCLPYFPDKVKHANSHQPDWAPV